MLRRISCLINDADIPRRTQGLTVVARYSTQPRRLSNDDGDVLAMFGRSGTQQFYFNEDELPADLPVAMFKIVSNTVVAMQ